MATDFYRRLLSSEAAKLWRKMSGAQALAALGIVQPSLLNSVMEERFAGQGQRENPHVWSAFTLEAWARARSTAISAYGVRS